MNRAKALQVLSSVKPELAQRFGVVRLALFGSTDRTRNRLIHGYLGIDNGTLE